MEIIASNNANQQRAPTRPTAYIREAYISRHIGFSGWQMDYDTDAGGVTTINANTQRQYNRMNADDDDDVDGQRITYIEDGLRSALTSIAVPLHRTSLQITQRDRLKVSTKRDDCTTHSFCHIPSGHLGDKHTTQRTFASCVSNGKKIFQEKENENPFVPSTRLSINGMRARFLSAQQKPWLSAFFLLLFRDNNNKLGGRRGNCSTHISTGPTAAKTR